ISTPPIITTTTSIRGNTGTATIRKTRCLAETTRCRRLLRPARSTGSTSNLNGMQIPLTDRRCRFLLVAVSAVCAMTYFAGTTAVFLADYFSSHSELVSLRRAAWLAPGDADYRYRIGRYFSLAQISPSDALSAYRSAVSLDPHRARYWFD